MPRQNLKSIVNDIHTIPGVIVTSIDIPVLDSATLWMTVNNERGEMVAAVALYADGVVGVSPPDSDGIDDKSDKNYKVSVHAVVEVAELAKARL
jgi:hypothetical protein